MSSTPKIMSRNLGPLASTESAQGLDKSNSKKPKKTPTTVVLAASNSNLSIQPHIQPTSTSVNSISSASLNSIETTSPPDSKCNNKLPSTGSLIDPEFEYKGYHKFGRILGKGSFGTVIECVRKCDQKPIALKLFKFKAIHKWIPEEMVANDLKEDVISKSEFFGKLFHSNDSTASVQTPSEEVMLPSEVACLIRASSIDGVVKILDYIPESNLESDICENNEDSIIGIVLERDPAEICFFNYLLHNKFLTEDKARPIMHQLVQICINLLHAGILHGDLKSENILINPKTKRIKVIDFGSAQLIDMNNSNTRVNSTARNGNHRDHSSEFAHHKCKSQAQNISKPFRTFRGTNLYKPPEYILHQCFYPRASTVWSFGIILYDMVCGNFPFDKDSDILTHQDHDIEFSRKNLSEGFQDLVKKCLAFYVCDRINIEKILNHSWLNTIEHAEPVPSSSKNARPC